MFQTDAMPHALVTCHSHFLSLLGEQCWLQTGQPGLGAASAGSALGVFSLPDTGGGLAGRHQLRASGPEPRRWQAGEEKSDRKDPDPGAPGGLVWRLTWHLFFPKTRGQCGQAPCEGPRLAGVGVPQGLPEGSFLAVSP